MINLEEINLSLAHKKTPDSQKRTGRKEVYLDLQKQTTSGGVLLWAWLR